MLEEIEVKRYGPEGKPLYDSIEEFHFCNEGRRHNNMKKMEA